MLIIFNDLEPFFNDNYRRINVREYSRIRKITPPTASKLLSGLQKEGLLKMENERNYIFYVANRENILFIHLSRIYWLLHLKKMGLIDYLEEELMSPLLILFGSLCKAEVKEKSDIDLAVFTVSQKNLNFEIFEKKLKRKIHFLWFKNKKDVKNVDLLNNIQNGFVISGRWT